MPSTARRRGTGYRALRQGLRIRCRRAGDHEIMRAVAASMQEHSKGLLAKQWLAAGPMESKGWHADFTGIFNLTPAEVDELRRRLNSVAECATLLGNKQAKRVYSKLGIHRRAELVSRIQEVLGGAAH